MPSLNYPIKENFYLGRVEEFSFRGLQAFFRSTDHYPPHFHVKKSGRWEIRVYILTSSKNGLDYSFKFPKNKSVTLTSKEEKAILDFVTSNREKLLLDWETQVCVREKMSDEP
ncbi:MAG: DUF4160 domain-containing protein [Waterburya sp.]